MKRKLMAILTAGAVLASSTIGAFATTIQIDGVTKIPTNAKGVALEVFNKNGSIYVPIRYVSESLGCTVGWDGYTETVKIQKPIQGFVMSTSGNYADVIIDKSWTTLDNSVLKATKYDLVNLREEIGKYSKQNDWGVVFKTDSGSVIIDKDIINSNIDYQNEPVNVYFYDGKAVGISGWDE